MSDGVHLLIPFAACSAPACQETLKTLALPQLERLLARLVPAAADAGSEHSLTPPHERVLAAACGLAAADGCIPWAAWQAQQAGRDAGQAAWAWITPCHWQIGTNQITMDLPQDLRLDAAGSQALLAAMQPFFSQDGITLEYEAPTLWLARGEIFRGLATASLDRVAGQDVDAWMPRQEAARTLRRLQQEMQMLLYTHAVNDERLTRGLLPVNSFWTSGAGALPALHQAAPPAGLRVASDLRDAALRGDGPAWAAAWQQLDAREGPRLIEALAQRQAVTLTLCGDANARSWSEAGSGLWHRMTHLLGRKPLSDVLRTL